MTRLKGRDDNRFGIQRVYVLRWRCQYGGMSIWWYGDGHGRQDREGDDDNQVVLGAPKANLPLPPSGGFTCRRGNRVSLKRDIVR